MNEEQIRKEGYKLHHTATRMGYTRAEDRGIGIPYEGRFGKGYIVPLGPYCKANGKKSTKYERIAYFVK